MTVSQQPSRISGKITNVRWRADTDDYAIIDIELNEKAPVGDIKTITTKGPIIEAATGCYVECFGQFHKDPKWGWQFKSDAILDYIPTDAKGILNYLKSSKIPGIGQVYAQKLVDAFGADLWNVVENAPWKLKRVQGVGEKRLDSLIQSVKQNRAVYEIMSKLRQYEITQANAVKIYKKWGAASLQKINENAYCLCEIPNIGFLTADKVALSSGVEHDSEFRIKAGIAHILEEESNNGNTAISVSDLINKRAPKLLGVDSKKIESALPSEINNNRIILENINDEPHLQLPKFHYAEKGIVTSLKRLMSHKNKWGDKNVEITNESLSAGQRAAVISAFKEKVLIITGGPGVGKTTVIKEILKNADQFNASVTLCAPTGRAARRMSEATGQSASTIHKTLEYKRDGGFAKNDENPIEGDIIIADEFSMVDTLLNHSLLKAIPSSTTLIIVGDDDQLASVGAGNVLSDLIESHKIPVVKLTEIFRQAKNSKIITNAHLINNCQMPVLDGGAGSDFRFVKAETNEEILSSVIRLMKSDIQKSDGISSQDIQVLTPMRVRALGTEELNKEIQAVINPPKPGADELSRFGVHYRINDRVMQFRNNSDLDISNGDVGIIKSINKEEHTMSIDFDGRLVTIESSDMDDIGHAFASTIHKSQGSEYKAVIIPMTTSHSNMLNKNLFYTAATRGKSIVYVVGQESAVRKAVSRRSDVKRVTALKSKLDASDLPEAEHGAGMRHKKSRHEAVEMTI